MSQTVEGELESVIREAGEGWLLDKFSPPSQAMPSMIRTLDQVQLVARERFGGNAPTISASSIVAEYNRNPLKIRAFLQALTGTRTPEMLLMAWRILQGMQITSVELKYTLEQCFHLEIRLRSPYGQEDPPYVTHSIFDFPLLRHLGSMELGGRPVFDGFYPLKLRR